MQTSFAVILEVSELIISDSPGKKDHIHISLVNEQAILAVVFDDRTTIGMVRLYCREAGEKLNEIFSEPWPDSQQEGLDVDFTRTAETRIDDIFGG